MLIEYRDACKRAASTIPDWENLNKNELLRLCVQYENDESMYNAYMAAVLYNYYPTIIKYYQSCKGLVSVEDCADWVEDAIAYALKHRKWEDPTSSIYNDPTGPDKVINRIMKCTRANLYQYTNRKKRKDAFGMKSLDAIAEAVHDNTLEIADSEDHIDRLNLDIKSYIKDVFLSKDYFTAYMIDIIINDNVFTYDREKCETVFDIKRLSRRICAINEKYCTRFADEYDLPEQTVIDTLRYFQGLNRNKLLYKIQATIKRLRHTDFFREQVNKK